MDYHPFKLSSERSRKSDTARHIQSDQPKFTEEQMKLLKNPFTVATIPKQVHFIDTTTIVIFHDGEIIVSRPTNGDKFDPEVGLAMCIAKRIYGSRRAFKQAVSKAKNKAGNR